ncbi:MAG TPA: hypothetical protein QGI07_02315 [Dehalococcoidia bacterium]|nr:hypothetical protein [Dehalococcoidia bacterium]MDP7161196.1 hypothetical protein [Dehalococcoidia bacterium]MDP7213554.1 hypothetical protein [Dehalococcoidia bacterium]MDP7515188.1 hypothetical protein [Dehalococcoidia bacterium]HJM52845.1 hypothetical protein [Dehalococcoidia bacterium]
MTEDPIPGSEQNEAYARLLAVVRRLEWAGLNAGAEATCPVCGAAGPGGPHLADCDLLAALDEATNSNRWPWCHCDACECPNQVNPAGSGALCGDCARGLHHDDRAVRDT